MASRPGWTVRAGRGRARLLAQTQPADDGQIAVAVLLAKVGEQAGPLADHLQQAAPAGVILLVLAHVLVQLVDASGEQRDLHFRRAGVTLLAPELVDDFQLAVLVDSHLDAVTSARCQILP